jgi:hypothetical protein
MKGQPALAQPHRISLALVPKQGGLRSVDDEALEQVPEAVG